MWTPSCTNSNAPCAPTNASSVGGVGLALGGKGVPALGEVPFVRRISSLSPSDSGVVVH